MFSFKVKKVDSGTGARSGVISTPHGKIHTPAFIPVGTQASVKSLSPEEIRETGTQIFFVNTYHQFLRPGDMVVKKMGGLHAFMNWNGPLITDSGGFQVFSLGNKKLSKMRGENETESLVKITDAGVEFRSHIDGSKHFFTPEKSIKIQVRLGADIILPLDECTFYPATHKYAQKALSRTHDWADKSLKYFKRLKNKRQALYGIVQGGIYEDLRVESATFIGALPFSGYAIGGVSVGESKDDMKKVVEWTIPLLPPDKPRHILGVGEIDDIFAIVERGADTFDCVMPTRIARMGKILVKNESEIGSESVVERKKRKMQKRHEIDITKAVFKTDKTPLDPSCTCYVCQSFTRSYIHHLFKSRELLGYRLATYHNVHFVNSLVGTIREAIDSSEFMALRKQWIP